ncbi:hypothetical protein Peur_068030 [Populus x canadensis]
MPCPETEGTIQPNTVALHQIKCHSSPTATSHPLLRQPNHQQSQNLKTQLYPSLNPLPSTFSSLFTDISSHWPFWDRYLRSAGSNLFQFFVVANVRTLFEHFILVRVDGALIDRPKLLGFVGTQTGFESGDRRAALRSTWFPCDPDGLLRTEGYSGDDLTNVCRDASLNGTRRTIVGRKRDENKNV